MEYTEAVVSEFLASLVAEALSENKPDMTVRYGQQRFVKTDPVSVACSWKLPSGGKSREFAVMFSGEAVVNFADADAERLARLRAAAIASIRSQHQGFDPADSAQPYPFLCQIDYLGV